MTVDVWERPVAACTDDPERQFPGNVAEEIAAAKAVCNGCPIRLECLQRAIDLGEGEGVWGGHTPGERKNLVLYGVAQRHYKAKAECPTCHRSVAIEGKGLRRHTRRDPKGAKGYSQCPGRKP